MNKVHFIGNLGKDPEVRYSKAGEAVANFSVGTRSGKDSTEWINAVCFKKTAELAGEYLKKGSKIYGEGTLKTSSWEADGVKRYKTEVLVNNIQFLDSKPKTEHAEMNATVREDAFDSDIPFAPLGAY